MNPDDDDQKVLTWQRQIGRKDPELIKLSRVPEFQAVKRFSESDGYRMGDEQNWNGQPQRELPKFAGRNAKMAPAIESVQSEPAMNDECGVKYEMARQGLPWLE